MFVGVKGGCRVTFLIRANLGGCPTRVQSPYRRKGKNWNVFTCTNQWVEDAGKGCMNPS